MPNKIQGEGDKEAARRFNQAQQEFVKGKRRRKVPAPNDTQDEDSGAQGAHEETDYIDDDDPTQVRREQ